MSEARCGSVASQEHGWFIKEQRMSAIQMLGAMHEVVTRLGKGT